MMKWITLLLQQNLWGNIFSFQNEFPAINFYNLFLVCLGFLHFHTLLIDSVIVYLARPVRWGDQDSLWPVNPSALTAEPSTRTTELAEPKKDHQAPENAPR